MQWLDKTCYDTTFLKIAKLLGAANPQTLSFARKLDRGTEAEVSIMARECIGGPLELLGAIAPITLLGC